MKTITVIRVAHCCYRATDETGSHVGNGNTPFEAVGDALQQNQQHFGVHVELEGAVPVRAEQLRLEPLR